MSQKLYFLKLSVIKFINEIIVLKFIGDFYVLHLVHVGWAFFVNSISKFNSIGPSLKLIMARCLHITGQ